MELCGDYQLGSDPRAGTFVGFWRDGAKDAVQSALVIENVGADGQAQVRYSHGRYDPWGLDYSECEKFSGKFLDEDNDVFADEYTKTREDPATPVPCCFGMIAIVNVPECSAKGGYA